MKLKIFIYLFLPLFLLSLCSSEKERQKNNTLEKKRDFKTLKAEFPFQGRIIFQSDLDGDDEIYLLTKLQLKKLTDNTWDDTYPRWSPDGTRIAFAANPKGHFNIFTMNEDGSGQSQLTDLPGDETEPAWLPDGKEIAFTREAKRLIGKDYSLWKMNLETKETSELIPEFGGEAGLADFSPVDSFMLFTGKKMFGWDVFVHDFQKKESRSLTEGGKSCRAYFSADGKKIVFVSSKADGRGDVWIMNPDGTDKIRLTERDETYDYFPAWSPDGKYIVFCSGRQNTHRKGPWSLSLVKVSTKSIIPLFSSSGRDLFPHWH